MLNSQWVSYSNHIDSLTQTQTKNNNIKTNKNNSIWPSTKERTNNSKNSSKHNHSTSYKDRHHGSHDYNHYHTIKCNTKRANSVMIDNFLNPIDDTTHFDETTTSANASSTTTIVQQQQSSTKRSIFSGSIKKKIGPMENENEKNSKKLFKRSHNNSIDIKTPPPPPQSLMTPQTNNDNNISTTATIMNSETNKMKFLDSCSFNNDQQINNCYEEEQGEFIMLPTMTNDLTHLHQLEIDTRILLNKLGVTTDMLLGAVQNGPRSDIIGAYRIIIHRIQKQAILTKQAELIAQEQAAKPKSNRTCAIL